MTRGLIALLVAVFALACTTGTKPRNFIPALGPNGVRGELTVRRGDTPIPVEVLGVDHSVFTVMTPTGIAVVRYTEFDAIVLAQIGSAFRGRNYRFWERVRQASRFPHGITPEIMSALLAESGQTEPRVLKRKP